MCIVEDYYNSNWS